MGRGAKPGERRGGRAKGTPNCNSREIKAYAQQYGTEAINTIVAIFKNAKLSARDRLDAASELLDRAYGKAAQPHRHSGNVGNYDLSKLTDDQLRASYEILRLAVPDTIGDDD